MRGKLSFFKKYNFFNKPNLISEEIRRGGGGFKTYRSGSNTTIKLQFCASKALHDLKKYFIFNVGGFWKKGYETWPALVLNFYPASRQCGEIFRQLFFNEMGWILFVLNIKKYYCKKSCTKNFLFKKYSQLFQ